MLPLLYHDHEVRFRASTEDPLCVRSSFSRRSPSATARADQPRELRVIGIRRGVSTSDCRWHAITLEGTRLQRWQHQQHATAPVHPRTITPTPVRDGRFGCSQPRSTAPPLTPTTIDGREPGYPWASVRSTTGPCGSGSRHCSVASSSRRGIPNHAWKNVPAESVRALQRSAAVPDRPVHRTSESCAVRQRCGSP